MITIDAIVPREHTGYRANLLLSASYLMRETGGYLAVRGHGNDTHVSFYTKDDRSCVVWFPTEGRVKDLDIADMKDAIREMSGHAPFTLL